MCVALQQLRKSDASLRPHTVVGHVYGGVLQVLQALLLRKNAKLGAPWASARVCIYAFAFVCVSCCACVSMCVCVRARACARKCDMNVGGIGNLKVLHTEDTFTLKQQRLVTGYSGITFTRCSCFCTPIQYVTTALSLP